MEEMNTNTQTQATDATPAENEAEAQGKTFTQEDVNRIVSERLAREKAKAESIADQRNQELTARENRLTCREFIAEGKHAEALLDVFDTSDAEKFKKSVEKLYAAFPGLQPGQKIPHFSMESHRSSDTGSLFAQAFKPKF